MLCGGIWYITYMCLFLCSTVCNYFIKISPNFHDCSIFLNATVASKLQVVTPLQTGLRLLRSSRSFAQHANEPSAKVKKRELPKRDCSAHLRRLLCGHRFLSVALRDSSSYQTGTAVPRPQPQPCTCQWSLQCASSATA